MTDPMEVIPQSNPVEVLGEHIARREAELAFLYAQFGSAMEVVSSLDRVNQVLAVSSRPELVMTRRVPQKYGNSPNDLGRLNNFVANLQSFGVQVYGQDETVSSTDESREELLGHRPYTEAEKAIIVQLSGRGEYDEFHAFAAEHGIDEKFARHALMFTLTAKQSFARMVIICPELTEYLMDKCLDTVDEPNKRTDEETFVAYALMSRLVDENDIYSKRHGSDEDDDWSLCH